MKAAVLKYFDPSDWPRRGWCRLLHEGRRRCKMAPPGGVWSEFKLFHPDIARWVEEADYHETAREVRKAVETTGHLPTRLYRAAARNLPRYTRTFLLPATLYDAVKARGRKGMRVGPFILSAADDKSANPGGIYVLRHGTEAAWRRYLGKIHQGQIEVRWPAGASVADEIALAVGAYDAADLI